MLRLSFGRGSGAGVSPSLTSEIQPRWAQGETKTSGACRFVCFADSTPLLLLSPTSGSPNHTPSSKASKSGSPHHHHHSARGCWRRPRCLGPRTLQLVGLTHPQLRPWAAHAKGFEGTGAETCPPFHRIGAFQTWCLFGAFCDTFKVFPLEMVIFHFQRLSGIC